MLMNFWQFNLSNCQGLHPVWAICFFCVQRITCLSIPTITQAKLTCYMKSQICLHG